MIGHARLAAAGVAAAGVAAALALSACTASGGQTTSRSPETPPAPDLARFYDQQIDWRSCDDAECGRLTVPVDYSDPEGATLELSVLRVTAGGDRRGSLVVDPGGPGASGTEYAAAASYIVSDDVADTFDIVGFDPRGVGGSAPISCGDDAQIDALIDADATPDSTVEVDALERVSAEFVASCTAPVAGLLEHMGTANAARDMDVLRAALGESSLDYLGVSYGTHLGATYAALFPGRVGRFVLDGPLPAEFDAEQLTLGQARGFEDSVRRFIADCITREDCPFRNADVDAAMLELAAALGDLDTDPLPTADPDRPLTEGAATYAVLMSMYSPDGDWPRLRTALSAMTSGDGQPLQAMLNERMRRDADGVYRDNSSEAFYAVSCIDRPVSGGVEAAQRLADEWRDELPLLGEYLAWGNLPCSTWPVEPVEPLLPSGPLPPILVVATTHDPATPLVWGDVLVEQLGSAVLLVRDGDGHTAYREGSGCIDDAIDAFLLDGVLPEPGVICD